MKCLEKNVKENCNFKQHRSLINCVLLGNGLTHYRWKNMNFNLFTYDRSIGSTETKYIKLNTKTQKIFQ